MDTFHAQILWSRSGGETAADFSRDHRIIIPGKLDVYGSAAPAYHGNPAVVNPEDLFLCSVSSCQMLTYVHLCYQNEMHITRYGDDAEAFLGRDSTGRTFVSVVMLKPMIAFESADSQPVRAAAIRLIREAHDQCFIGNSVKTDVQIEPRFFFE